MASLIIVLITSILSLLTSYYRDLYSLDVYAQNLKATQPIALEESARFPGSTEEVIIKASPQTEKDVVALVRLSFDNAEVLDVEPLQALAFGTCEKGQLFTQNTICADIATTEYFTNGDPLLKATIKWGEEGQSLITAGAENGYYDGFNLNSDMMNMAVDINGILPFTGEDTKQPLENDQSLTVFLVIAGGFFVVLIILILVTRTHPVFRKIPVYYSILSILVLGSLAIFIGQNSNNIQIKNIAAAPLPLDDWFRCRQEYQVVCEWISNATQFCGAEIEEKARERGINLDMYGMALKCDSEVAYCKFCAPCGANPTHLWVLCEGVPFSTKCYNKAAGTKECYYDFSIVCGEGGGVASVSDCKPVNSCTVGYGCGVVATVDPTPTPEKAAYLGVLTSTLPPNVSDQQELEIRFTLKKNHEWIRSKIQEICGEDFDYENRCDDFRNWILVEVSNGTIESAKYNDGGNWKDQGGAFMYPTTFGNNRLIVFPAFSYDKEMSHTIKAIKPNTGNMGITVQLLVGNMNDIMSPEEAYNSDADRRAIVAPITITFNEGGDPEPTGEVDKCSQIPDADWDEKGFYCSPIDGEDNIVIYCNDDKTEDPSKQLTCSGDCVKEDPGTNDHCPTSPTGTVNPTITLNPTITVNPTNTIQPTPTMGVYQCGQKGCTSDSQCETGLPNYECDESETNWPNENICVRICPAGTTQTGPCECSSDNESIQCGPMDVNGDNILNYIDFAPFVRAYNKSCNDSPYTGGGCGGKDNNGDGKVNYIDFGFLVKHYYPRAQTCLP